MASNFTEGINILDTSNSSGINSGGSLNVRGGASFGKDIYIGGNVNISGTTTAFSDNIILINQNPQISSDTGFLFERHSNDILNNKKYSGIIYSETTDQFVFGYLQNDANRGTITTNGFIGIQSENLTLYSTQNSIGVGSGGTLNIMGGGSITKDMYIGGNLHFTGNLYQNGILFSVGNESQWISTVSSDIYYTSGNVGIGTTAPSQKLDVDGTIKATTYTGANVQVTNINSTNFTSGTAVVNSLITNTGITSGSLIITGGSLNATFNSNTIGSIITTGGNVGIGTNNPTKKLDINGDINFGSATVGGNLIPSTNVTYDLGSSTNKWKDLYLSGNTIHLNDQTFSVNTSGSFVFSSNLEQNQFVDSDTLVTYIEKHENSLAFLNDNINTYLTGTNFTWGNYVQASYYSGLLNNTDKDLQILINFNGVVTNNSTSGNLTVTFFVTNSAGSLISTLYEVTPNPGTPMPMPFPPFEYVSEAYKSFNSGYIQTTVPIGGSIKINENSSNSNIKINLGAFNSGTGINIKNKETIFMSSTSGNIGIGTTNPETKLDIKGTLKVTGELFVTGGSLKATFDSNTLGSLITTGGNVGIGTNSPSQKLDIVGGSLRITGGSLLATFNSNTLGSLITTGGNVGIGTNSPSQKLDIVGGSLRITGGSLNATFDSNTIGSIITTGGNIGIGTTAPSVRLDVRGTTNLIVAQEDVNDSNWRGRILSKNATADRATFIGTISGNSVVAAHNNALNAWAPIFINTTNGGGDGANVLLAGTGSVGIGTSNPSATLHLFKGATTNQTGPAIRMMRSGDTFGACIWSGVDSTIGEYLRFGVKNGGDPRSFPVITVGETNVGIGTSSPSVKLDILTSGTRSLKLKSSSTSNYMDMYNSDESSRLIMGIDGVGLADVSAGAGILGTWTSRPFLFFTNATERMRIDSSGNIGIGTTAPTDARLHVYNGSAASRINIDAPLAQQAGLSFRTANAENFVLYRPANLTSLAIYVNSTGNNEFTLTSTGNVGIGTESPNVGYGGNISNVRLALKNGVVGQAGGTATILIGGDNSHYSSITGSHTGGGNTYLSFGTATGAFNPTEKMRIDSSGNVGVGTSSPTLARLQVEGSATTSQFDTGYLFTTTSGMSGSVPTGDGISRTMSVYASSWIVSRSGFLAYSDRRIKNEIEDVNDESALNILRQLKPKMYRYIDKVEKGNVKVYGFIAQEVGELIENSTEKTTQYIPNVYKKATFVKNESENVLNFSEVVELDNTNNSTKKLKLYDINNKEYIVTLKQIISQMSFTIDEELSEQDYFVYGQEVLDFHSLNKDSIWTVATAALQEVDRQLQTERQEHLQTKQRLETLETFIKGKFPGEF